MIQIHPCRDRAMHPLVDRSMRSQRARLVTATYRDSAVAVPIKRAIRRKPALVLAQNLPQNEKLHRQSLFHFFLFAPRTRSNLGFAFFAAGLALRVEAARIAPARLLLIPCLAAMLDCTDLKPGCFFAICPSVQLRPHARQPLVVLLDAVERLRFG